MKDDLRRQLEEIDRMIDEQWQRIDAAQADYDAKDEQTKAAAKVLGEVESEFLAFAHANGNDRVIRLNDANEATFADIQERRSAAWSKQMETLQISGVAAGNILRLHNVLDQLWWRKHRIEDALENL